MLNGCPVGKIAKNSLKECVYVNSALKLQCHVVKNTHRVIEILDFLNLLFTIKISHTKSGKLLLGVDNGNLPKRNIKDILYIIYLFRRRKENKNAIIFVLKKCTAKIGQSLHLER